MLLGERTLRFSPSDGEWVDVCALCTDEAYEHGWVREGSPTSPVVPAGQKRRRRFAPLGFLGERRAETEPTADEPVLRRLSQPEQAMLQASEHFNESAFRRTVAGIQKSLGDPRVSFLPLSGTNPEVVITVAWDISWYQYRVVFGSNQPVRLAERGYELDAWTRASRAGTDRSILRAARCPTSHESSSGWRSPEQLLQFEA